MPQIQMILMEPCRSEAAKALYPDPNCTVQRRKRDEFRGPVFEDAKLIVKEGVATIVVPEATYFYPLHTIARIKETK